jgi:hypothetical protein
VFDFAQYFENLIDSLCGGREAAENPARGGIRMTTTTTGSAHYAGLLPVPVRLTTLENERFSNWRRSLRKRALHALSVLIAGCTGVAVASAWWSYGDATRQMIESSYHQRSWLAPRQAAVQKAPDTIAPAGAAAPYRDQRQLDAMLGDDLRAMRLSLDRIVAGQELLTRAVEEIATSIAARQEQMTRNTEQNATSVGTGEPTKRRTDQTATTIGAGREPTMRSTDQTAATITTGQGQMTSNSDQTITSVDQTRSAKTASSIAVESRGDAVSLQPTLRLKPTEAKPPQTSSERGKQLAAASGHDAPCFPSASAVLQNNPGASPTWTLRAPGHEGTQCWRAAALPGGSDHRPSASAHRREMMPKEPEADGTKENTLFPPPYTLPSE